MVCDKQNFSPMAMASQHKERRITSPTPSNTINILDIPEDVIIKKILVLIEAKSLGRLRCVSKWWNNRISSPRFCLLYYRFWSQHQFHHYINGHLLRNESGDYKFAFATTTLLDPSHCESLTFRSPIKSISMISRSSCFGLICFYNYEKACIYNLTTRTVVVELPSHDNISQYIPNIELGLVPSTNQFKVVCLPSGTCSDPPYIYYKECHVLTLPEDLSKGWREVASPLSSNIFKPIIASSEGAIYVLTLCLQSLFRFDLKREKWSSIKLPTLNMNIAQPIEFMGYLCLSVKTTQSLNEIWMLRDGNVWVKEWELNAHPRKPRRFLYPLYYDENLERIMLFDCKGLLRWYWIKKGVYEELYYMYDPIRKMTFNLQYVQTLASLETLRGIVGVN